METSHDSFTKLFECYIDTWSLFAKLFLTGQTPLHRQDEMTIPLHLQAQYSLLQLHTEANLTDVRKKYRELARLYHPDTGGYHADFLALQRAYEQVVEYLQTLP